MGHVRQTVIAEAVKKGLVVGVDLDPQSKAEFCETYGKLVHTDLCGPAQTTSLGGSRSKHMNHGSPANPQESTYAKYARIEEGSTSAQNLTTQQNGVAERLNRTLVECARAMLLGKDMPKYLPERYPAARRTSSCANPNWTYPRCESLE